MLQILVLRMKGYTEKDICTCLGICFDGQQGGMTTLLFETNIDQLIDLNQHPLSQSILEDKHSNINPPHTGTTTNIVLSALSKFIYI
jgi:hypothetical protein